MKKKIKIIGIYKIQSLIKPERIYIGSSCRVEQRWGEHAYFLSINKHHSKKLQNHYNKYGLPDLVFSLILTCDIESLIKIEQFFIDTYNPFFNTRPTAESNRGHKMSEETKRKISESQKGKIIPLDQRQKMSEAKKGKTPCNKGVKMSDEQREKLKASHKGMTGRKHSNETIEKMRESKKKRDLKLTA